MFRIDHVSDRHGSFPKLSPRSIMVIDSGDDLPNHAPRASTVAADIPEEIRFQRAWVQENIETYRTWLGGRIYVWSGGNHTFIDPTPILRNHGILAYNTDEAAPESGPGGPESVVNVAGIRFYGFPYVPRIQGHWAGELDHEQMREAVSKIPASGIDILIAHCPPLGILCDEEDPNRPGFKLGNQHLASWLDYECGELPKFLLCGHFHYSHGTALYVRDETGEGEPNSPAMIVSNAATTVHCFEYR